MTTSPVHRALLTARMARHLHVSQVVHRARLRVQRAAVARAPNLFRTAFRRAARGNPGWPENFAPLDGSVSGEDPSAVADATGVFTFLGEERSLGDPPDWEQRAAPRLWRYHLHYWEWAWALARHPDPAWARGEFAALWQSWRHSTGFGRGDAWSPYVVSLRSWAFCGVHRPLVAGSQHEAIFLADLAVHAGFVRAHLELDVGGNHLIKNLKALVGLGVSLGDEDLVGLGVSHLARQLPVQVLDDGGHFERSPSYHCQVLGDLIDIAELLSAGDRPPVEGLDDALSLMRRWLGAMRMPDGDLPLLNDCTLLGGERIAALEPDPRPLERVVVLQPSGYVVVRPDERIHLVADVGPPCPPELPAHAHADCLSFELAIDGHRAVVDSGTSTYEGGSRREYERSTAAHNTVEIDGENQTEVWDAFRAGRRAEPTIERVSDDGETIEVIASHDGYARLPGAPRHRRTWRAEAGRVRLIDEVFGDHTHRSVGRLHLAPRLPLEPRGKGAFRAGELDLDVVAGGNRWETADVATGFGRLSPVACLVAMAEGPLPHRIETSLTLRPVAAGRPEPRR